MSDIKVSDLAKEYNIKSNDLIALINDSEEFKVLAPKTPSSKLAWSFYENDLRAYIVKAMETGAISSDEKKPDEKGRKKVPPKTEKTEGGKTEKELPPKNDTDEEAGTVMKEAPAKGNPEKPIPAKIAGPKSPGALPPAITKAPPKTPPIISIKKPEPKPAPVAKMPPLPAPERVSEPPAPPQKSPAPMAPPIGKPAPKTPPIPPKKPEEISAPAPASTEPVSKPKQPEPNVAPIVKIPPPPVSRPPMTPPMGRIPPKTPGATPPLPRSGTSPAAQTTPAGAISNADAPAQTVVMRPPIVVRDFAIALNTRPFRLISELMEMGIFASLNQTIEESVAVRIAAKHGINLEVRHRGDAPQQPKGEAEKPKADDPKLLVSRPPVVCVLGHVDHGKTTLLDFYRKTSVVSGEAGGITQHIGAYSVEHKDKAGKSHHITFLDTPGHAAFSKMRERGAEVTDIAILVVAADDGFMPQTDEALKFAQKNNVQIVVAINKADAKGANIDRVKQQMQQRNIASEDWGGEILTTPVSALKGTGMDTLLDSILLQAEMMDLKANPKCHAEGTVIEAQMEVGRGPTSTLIVQKGTLKIGDAFVCAQHYCKVRALLDDAGRRLQSVPPGTPALVLGWSGVPTPGAIFQVCKNEREAKALAEENALNLRKALEEEADEVKAAKIADLNKLSSMDRLMAAIQQTKDKTLKVLCKADVNGTLEALVGCLESIKSDKVKLEVIASSVGPITPNDVNVASAGGATIVAFDVKQENGVGAILKRTGVQVITHDIIYMLIDMVRNAMADLLDPEIRENKVGMAEVRALFPHGKNGSVAGCMVTEGRIQRDFKARLYRKNQVIHAGIIDTLKRFKDDATEVKAGYECGIRLEHFDTYQIGDQIECFELLQTRPAL